MTPIVFYDVEIEAIREATQVDWDQLIWHAKRMHEDMAVLQRLLEANGIAVPDGVRRREAVGLNPPR